MSLRQYFRNIKYAKKQRTLLSDITETSIVINGVTFKVEVFEGHGSSISARIKNESMVIIIPSRLSSKKKLEAIERIKARLVRRLEKFDGTELSLMQNSKLIFKEGSIITILGENYTISILKKEIKMARGKVKENILEIQIPTSIEPKLEEEVVSKISKKLLSKAIQSKAQLLLESINNNFYNYPLNKLRIHEQQRLWGSYSHHSKNITLNLKLFFAPTPIIEYVMAHELSHIKVSKHSKRFWDNVAIAVPDYKERRKWLRRNGNKLGFVEPIPYSK